MKKEEKQTVSESVNAENAALKARIAELETELSGVKQQLAATAGANAILEGNLKEQTEKVKALSEAPKAEDRISALHKAVCRSCADHCPHHMDAEACKNCSINKLVVSAGMKIQKEEC